MSEKMNKRPMGRPMGGPPGPGMGGPVEKAKNFRGTWVKLIGYCRNYLPAILVSLAFAAAGTVLQVIGPDKLSEMTDEITKGLMGAIDLNAVVRIALVLVFYYALSTVLNFVQGYIMATVTARISKRLRSGISQKINKLPLRYFDQVSYGDILSRVTNDVDTIGQTLNQSIGTLVSAITMLAGSLIMMFYTSWILALTAIGASVIGFALMMIIMARSQKYFTRQQESFFFFYCEI